MRLVWAIIPLVLFSIIGIQESFEEDYSYNFGKMELYRGPDIDSPKVQFENGAERHEIICKDLLYLVYKTSDGSPACVEEYFSAPKLIDRGWATLGETSLVITTDKEVYSLGENVTITMKNDGETLLTFSGLPDFYIHDESENDVELPLDRIVPPTENLVPFDTLASTTFVWNQTARDGEPAKPGIYTIFTNYMQPLPSDNLSELGNQWLETTKTFEITDKTWVAIVPRQATNPWQIEGIGIGEYYEKQGITIYNMTSLVSDPHPHCEAEGCPSWNTVFLLISDSDVQQMLDSGFYTVPKPDKQYHYD